MTEKAIEFTVGTLVMDMIVVQDRVIIGKAHGISVRASDVLFVETIDLVDPVVSVNKLGLIVDPHERIELWEGTDSYGVWRIAEAQAISSRGRFVRFEGAHLHYVGKGEDWKADDAEPDEDLKAGDLVETYIPRKNVYGEAIVVRCREGPRGSKKVTLRALGKPFNKGRASVRKVGEL